MIYTTDLGEKLQRVLAIAKDHKIPMLLDDAAGIPPADNARLYARMRIDLYCLLRRKGALRAAVQRFASGSQGSDRSGPAEFQLHAKELCAAP